MKKFLFASLGLMLWPIVELVIAAVLYFAIIILFGINFSSPNPMQGVQLIAWMTIGSGVVLFEIWRKLGSKVRTPKLSMLRGTLLAYLGIGLAIGSLLTFATYTAATNGDNTTGSGCNIDNTLSKAKAATFPIATESGTGTAFAIDQHGEMVTAYHVIAGSKEIYLNITPAKLPMTVISVSPSYDLALLRANYPTPQYLVFSQKFDSPDKVYAIGWPGNAFGFGKSTVTSGIISRIIDGASAKNADSSLPSDLDFVQTDAALNPGNSGGPLIGACGVVGVVDAISEAETFQGLPREEGISYAVSSKTVSQVLHLTSK